MLHNIAAVFEFLHTLLLIVCRTAWMFGRLLAALLHGLSHACVVFYEEFACFGHDLYEIADELHGFLCNSGTNLLDAVLHLADMATELLTTGRIAVDKLPLQLHMTLTIGRNSLRDFITLIGNSVWLLLTLLPNVVLFFVRSICVLVRSAAAALLEFFTEMPTESLLGFGLFIVLLALHSFTVPLARVVVRCALRTIIVPARVALSNRIREGVAQCRQQLQLSLRWCWSQYLLTIVWRKSQKRAGCAESSPMRPADGDNVCVICADQPKTVVLLPCRHMCLCEGCSHSLLGIYAQICPMCRRPVEHAMHVFS